MLESWSSTAFSTYGTDLGVKSTPLQSNKITAATATTANADRRPSAIRKISPLQPRYIRNTSFSGRVRWLIRAEESTFAELEGEVKRNIFERARE